MPVIGEIQQFDSVVKIKSIWLACGNCGDERWVRYIPSKQPNLCKKCYDIERKKYAYRGEDSHAWRGGRILRKGGYIAIHLSPDSPFFSMADGNHYVPEHRLVMAQYLGRCLASSEHIHHLNGIRDDNRIENLEIATPSEHTPQAHYKRRIRELEEKVAKLEGVDG